MKDRYINICVDFAPENHTTYALKGIKTDTEQSFNALDDAFRIYFAGKICVTVKLDTPLCYNNGLYKGYFKYREICFYFIQNKNYYKIRIFFWFSSNYSDIQRDIG